MCELVLLLLLLNGPKQDLVSAASSGNLALVEQILSSGADVNQVQELTGWSPLAAAAFHVHIDVVKTLLQAGADVNLPDRNGGTPLMKAVTAVGPESKESEKTALVKLLLDAGADPQIRDKFGSNPWEAALVNEDWKVVDVFENAGVRGVLEGRLMHAIANKNTAEVHRLLAAGADVNLKDEDGWNAVRETVLANQPEIMAAVLSSGADLTLRYDEGWTALMIAAHSSDLPIVQALLDAGADPEAQTPDGVTAIMIAMKRGDAAVVQALQAGSKLDSSETSP